MLLKNNENRILIIIIAAALCLVMILGIFKLYKSRGEKITQTKEQTAPLEKSQVNKVPVDEGTVEGEIIVMPTIDYDDLKKNESLDQLMKSRKDSLGIKKSLDMIVKSDENFKIGGVKISMRDILEKAFINKGEVFQEKIDASGAVIPEKIKEYGIYVVKPGDNIWNIHFNILKEYYDYKGINVSSNADEPGDRGMSSGVGKILKFSETMVIIYNLLEKKVDTNIDLLEPLSKVIVYNMEEVFSLLQQVNYDNIERIQFDGKTIWIPTKKS